MRTRPTPYATLTTPAPIFRPYAFDHVEVDCLSFSKDHKKHVITQFSLLDVCWSPYSSGPSITMLADAAAEVCGHGGFFGLIACRKRGFQKVSEPEA